MEKYLGKITKAEFGIFHDYPNLIGLQLSFSFDGKAVETGTIYAENIKYLNNESFEEHTYRFAIMINDLYNTLREAKVDYVSQLVNKSVELSIEGNLLKDFRILTGNKNINTPYYDKNGVNIKLGNIVRDNNDRDVKWIIYPPIGKVERDGEQFVIKQVGSGCCETHEGEILFFGFSDYKNNPNAWNGFEIVN